MPSYQDRASTSRATERGREPAADAFTLLDTPPPLLEFLRDDTRLTPRWTHPILDGNVAGTAGHLVGLLYTKSADVTGRLGSDRRLTRVRPRTCVIIPEGCDGYWSVSAPIEVSHVFLTDQRLQSCADAVSGGREVELLDRLGVDDPTAMRLMEILGQEAASNEPASRLFLEQAVDLLCTQLVRCHSSRGALPVANRQRGLADWQVKRVTAYMRDHLDQDIGLQELAALVRLSRFHFCTAFRLATGCTPYEWLTAHRMHRARVLLAEPTLRIIDVGFAVGYRTPSAFAASFRRDAGITPSEFRRRL